MTRGLEFPSMLFPEMLRSFFVFYKIFNWPISDPLEFYGVKVYHNSEGRKTGLVLLMGYPKLDAFY